MGRQPVVIGVDFGTLSGRAVVVSASSGEELGSAVHEYGHGVLDQRLPTGRTLPAGWALQVPQDWRDVLSNAVPAALQQSGSRRGDVIGIGTDFTACTVLPVTSEGTPLCEVAGFQDRPHAYPKLWKHHASQPQASRINSVARDRQEPWLSRYGGAISAEWQFAKALQVLEEDPEVYDAMALWVEAADWIVWQLTGRLVRNPCTAGYKGIYQDGRYPDSEFLAALHPRFASFAATRLSGSMLDLGAPAGSITERGSLLTGLERGTVVSVGNVDAHVTAAAAQATRPGRLVAIMGTSSCHVINGEALQDVPGMCGVVDGGIVKGLWGYEAGQSGVGDILAWLINKLTPEAHIARAREQGIEPHDYLLSLTSDLPVGGHGLIALDWQSGNRSILVNHDLSGLLLGLNLSTTAQEIYLALLESTAFGTRTIIEAFRNSDVRIDEFIAAGGLSQRPAVVQRYSDITGMPIRTVASQHGPALGSAIHAAVAAGFYSDVTAASDCMGSVSEHVVEPDPSRTTAYSCLYEEYRELHDYFGRGGNDVMLRLSRMRRDVHT